MAASVIQR